MQRSAFLLGALLTASAFTMSAAAQTPSAFDVLTSMKAASGGAAWDKIIALHTVSKITQGGLSGTQDEEDDVLTGRYSISLVLGPTSERDGFDGEKAWNQDNSGQSRFVAAADDIGAAKSNAYRVSLSYWFPQRRAGTVSYLRQASDGGRRLDVLQVTPNGGRPFQMWIDGGTHRLDRIVEPGAEETETTFFSDYRSVSGLVVPYQARSTTGDPRYDAISVTRSVTVNVPVSPKTFALPPPPPPDYSLGGASSVTVPFRYAGDHIYVDIKINGHGPFPAILDSGAQYGATPALARRAGLKVQGALEGTGNGPKRVDVGLARAETVTLGSLTLRRPLFYVIPLPALRDRPIIGYELFKRFVIRIDYDKNLLTFTLPNRFEYHSRGASVPFRFNGRTPEVSGTVDGVPGTFTIDTGAGRSVRLNRPFVEAHGLTTRYKPRFQTIIGYGDGGPERGGVVRLGRMTLGGVEVGSIPATLALDVAGGGADKAVAGNVGEGILHRFNLIFDYSRMRIIFERNSHYGDRDTEYRTGMTINPNAPEALVSDVISGSPAAQAGIQVGDVIEALNSHVLLNDAFSPQFSLFRQPAGTRLHLQVRSGHSIHTVTLVLRDLI